MWKRDESVATPPQPERPPQAAPPQRGESAEKLVMNLGKSVVIKGELSGSEDLTLYGQMEGSVKLPDHTLTIGPHAEIKAKIAAKTVVVMGAVIGNVTAGHKVDIQATGSVTGDIVTSRIAIADGGCLRGRVEIVAQPRP
jgi:cytoskeletal protein CcmA (bactofilin family)